MLSDLAKRRLRFADAHRRVMAPAAPVGYTPRDDEDSRLIRDRRAERIDLKGVDRGFSPKKSIGELSCGWVFHVIQCITDGTEARRSFR